MKTSIRAFRGSMKRILDVVRHGGEVTIYSRKLPIAKIIPIKSMKSTGEDYGFGMWRDHKETTDVASYVRKLRKGRQHDI